MALCRIFILIVIVHLKYYVHGTIIYVTENSTSVLRCPFKTKNARIDWTGPPNFLIYTLGRVVNPKLPHSDRISVVGQIEEGEYNLRISNIQQSDKGQYQCVGIISNISETAQVELDIAVPPETGPSLSRSPPGHIFVSSTILLKCEVSGGTPLANISWQCDGFFGEHDASTDTKIESTVNLTLKESDNNKNCTCIANHPSWTSPESVDIFLNVFFAPDKNLTIQRTPAGGIISGNKVTLTCIASGGNPLATLSWNCSGTNTNYTTENTVSYSVEFEVDKSDNNKLCTCSATHPVNSYSPQAHTRLIVYYVPGTNPIIYQKPFGGIPVGDTVTLTCTVPGGNPLATLSWNCTGISKNETVVNTASYSIEFTVNKSFNNKICACTADHKINDYKPTVQHNLVVYYAPSDRPIIQQTPPGGIITGRTVILTCSVKGGNPPAILTWNCTGDTTNSTTDTTATYSVSFSVNKTQNKAICTCSASHPVKSYTHVIEHILDVYYEPGTNPIISQNPPGGILTGHNVTLTCTVPGGNPLAILSWNCTGTKGNNTAGNTASHSITLSVNKTFNNKICRCTADHVISTYKPTVQKNLVVYYAPNDRPSIQQTPDGGISTGRTVILTCSVKGGNPPAILTWNCTGDTTNSTTDTTATYSVSFSVNKTQDNAICACSASHPDPSYTYVIGHSLDVYFGPGMPKVTPVPIMPWFEGNNTQLKCSFENGNPDATIVWKRENGDVQSTENRDLYDFHNLNRKDNGSTVTCVVYNEYSNKSKLLDIIVEYYPSVVVEHSYVLTSEGKNISIDCNAIGNPVPFVKWIRDKSQITGPNTGHSILIINNIDRNNESTYTCTASATSGTYGTLTTKANVSVVVNYAPDVTVNRNFSDIEEGKNLKLQCIANGKPSHFVYGWRHMFRNKVIRTFESNSGTLLLENLSYRDFGHYECIVNNGIEDRHGRLNQTHGTEIEVKYRPVFIHLNTDITAKVEDNVTTVVEFISFPDINGVVQWINSTDNSIMVNSSNLFTTLHRQTVDTTIYGKNVSVNTFSYRSALVLPKFEIDQAGFYILQVNNTVGGNNITLRIVVSDRPKPPTQFGASVIGSTTVTLAWTSGYNGGNQQTFIITYWEINSLHKNSKNVTEISEKNDYEEIIQDLRPSTTYVFVINSTNVEGISEAANNTVMYKTKGISETTSSILGPVGGSIGGTIFVILIIMIVVFIMRKQSGKTRRKTDRKNLTLTSREEDDEDGLKDNELYVSAGDDLNPGTGPGGVYAVVDKSNGKKSNAKQNIQETCMYAEVNKRNNAPIKATLDSNDESQKKLKTNRKGKNKMEKKRNDDVYENISEGNHRQIDYTNKNKDGLVYADLVFVDDGKRKFVIRGIENKTEYADVDLSIKVDPLPSDESDKEDEEVTNSSRGVQEPQ